LHARARARAHGPIDLLFTNLNAFREKNYAEHNACARFQTVLTDRSIPVALKALMYSKLPTFWFSSPIIGGHLPFFRLEHVHIPKANGILLKRALRPPSPSPLPDSIRKEVSPARPIKGGGTLRFSST
jgi:hypothetical protein